MENKKVVIIGAGPAGITCAIYLKRAGFTPYLIEGMMPGGKVSSTYIVENYPGYDSINGADLAFKFMNQLEANKIDINFETVLELKKQEEGVYLKTTNGEYLCEVAIIATGTKERTLDIEGEKKFLHKGISFCAVCDGGFYKNQPMAIIGGGNSALEEALYLENIANPLYLIHRRNEFRGDQILVDQVNNNENIKVLTPYIPLEFIGDDKLEGIVLENKDTKEKKTIEVKGCFEYVGMLPNTEFVKEESILNERGYVLANKKMETKIPGIYAIGDVLDKDLRQIVTANSDGAICAINVANYLKK